MFPKLRALTWELPEIRPALYLQDAPEGSRRNPALAEFRRRDLDTMVSTSVGKLSLVLIVLRGVWPSRKPLANRMRGEQIGLLR